MSHYVGIDPASLRAGIAAIDENGDILHGAITVTGELPTRLVNLRAAARKWLQPIADDGAFCVVIERPGTRFGGASLMAAYGVLTEAAQSMLTCPVMTLSSAEWKRLALANGAAKKPDVMVHARLLGYEGASQDVADAIGCADAARSLFNSKMRSAA